MPSPTPRLMRSRSPSGVQVGVQGGIQVGRVEERPQAGACQAPRRQTEAENEVQTGARPRQKAQMTTPKRAWSLRRYLVAGVLVWLPILASLWVITSSWG